MADGGDNTFNYTGTAGSMRRGLASAVKLETSGTGPMMGAEVVPTGGPGKTAQKSDGDKHWWSSGDYDATAGSFGASKDDTNKHWTGSADYDRTDALLSGDGRKGDNKNKKKDDKKDVGTKDNATKSNYTVTSAPVLKL